VLWNWFSVDVTFMVLDSEEANEGVARAPLEIKVARSTKVSRAHFLHASIGLNEEMDNVEEIGGTNTQP
jgi:hypothetical protein